MEPVLVWFLVGVIAAGLLRLLFWPGYHHDKSTPNKPTRTSRRAALERLVDSLFAYDPGRRLYRFRGGADPDGAARITEEALNQMMVDALGEQ